MTHGWRAFGLRGLRAISVLSVLSRRVRGHRLVVALEVGVLCLWRRLAGAMTST